MFFDALELFVPFNWSVMMLPGCMDAMSRVSAWHVHCSSSFVEFFAVIGPFSDYNGLYS